MSIYQPSFMSPNGNAVTLASTPVVFSSQVNGSLITHYQDIIYRADTGATLYDSTKLAVSPNLYDKDTLSKTVSSGTVTYTGSCKWTRTLWNGTPFATSREVQFYSASTPTATLSVSSPITTKSNLFTTVYTQAESVAVESYQYFLYDSTNALIDQSDVIFSQRLSYTFDGFLDATTYKVQCLITNIYGQVADTGLVSFTVDYSQPNIYFTPTISLNGPLSAVEIGFSEVSQVIGTSSGTISYIDNYLTTGNVGLQLLNSSAYVSFDVSIPNTFTQTITFDPNGFTSGVIISYDNGVYDIGYDGTRFYFSYYINFEKLYEYGTVMALNTNPYVIGVRATDVVICQNNVIIDTIKVF